MRFLAGLVGLFTAFNLASACPLCGDGGKTFSDEVKSANVILFGTLKNAKRDAADPGEGTTEMEIEAVVKDADFIKDMKSVTLPRYVPLDPKKPFKYLVFCEVYKGKLDPYRGIPMDPKSKMGEYMVGARKLIDKDRQTRLKYYFNYLDSQEIDISVDSMKEFANADYKDVRAVAPALPGAKIAEWLADENTPPSRYGLYGLLLGHCGDAKKHGPVFRKLLDDPKKRTLTGLDGVMAGYILLDPKEGWANLQNLLRDRKQEALATGLFPGAVAAAWTVEKPGREEFLTRYAGLRAVRFLWTDREDVAPHARIVELLAPLLHQEDICDLVIEDFRKWGRWEFTDKILALFNEPAFSPMIVKRSILRFALSAPDNTNAKEFVAKLRKEDPELVSSVEDLLEPAPKK